MNINHARFSEIKSCCKVDIDDFISENLVELDFIYQKREPFKFDYYPGKNLLHFLNIQYCDMLGLKICVQDL